MLQSHQRLEEEGIELIMIGRSAFVVGETFIRLCSSFRFMFRKFVEISKDNSLGEDVHLLGVSNAKS
jgi:hypothetical protein